MTSSHTRTPQSEAVMLRSRAGLWRRDTHAFIRFSGPDTASWLQSQTSNNVLTLESGQGHANAHLDRKGRLQGHFTLHRWEDEYWMLVDKSMAAHLLASLKAHLFIEKVEITDATGEVGQICLQGPRSRATVAACDSEAATGLPLESCDVRPLLIQGQQVLAFQISETGEDGFVFVTDAEETGRLYGALLDAGHAFGLGEAGEDAREVLRIEAGIPRFGADMDHTNRLPETTLERVAVDYNKGCYVGQEVITKLKTYSAPKFVLMGLVFDDAAGKMPPNGAVIHADGKQAGTVRSSAYSPGLGKHIALAYLDKAHRTPGSICLIDCPDTGQPLRAEVVVLPFIEPPSREERARDLYEEALDRFHQDAEDEDDSAIELLKEAVLLHPSFEDAYETLGVILQRHGRLDEAIRYMKVLEQLNPDCVMAHTNLSVFYMSKGMIQEAEEEKAKAAVLQMQHARNARKAEEIAAQERKRIEAEARERIGMFEEVLELDPEDPLATFGMGAAYMQLGQYEEAVPYLEKATRVQKDYSAAFLNLGKCREFLGQEAEAIEAYRRGIEAATKKGDFMPLREMERRLNGLTAEGSPASP